MTAPAAGGAQADLERHLDQALVRFADALRADGYDERAVADALVFGRQQHRAILIEVLADLAAQFSAADLETSAGPAE